MQRWSLHSPRKQILQASASPTSPTPLPVPSPCSAVLRFLTGMHKICSRSWQDFYDAHFTRASADTVHAAQTTVSVISKAGSACRGQRSASQTMRLRDGPTDRENDCTFCHVNVPYTYTTSRQASGYHNIARDPLRASALAAGASHAQRRELPEDILEVACESRIETHDAAEYFMHYRVLVEHVEQLSTHIPPPWILASSSW